ncbi:MAG: DUF2505 family protein [Arcanobacterium sp.]|nr:DUF2505 family protein [Arcanobacterium sp.]
MKISLSQQFSSSEQDLFKVLFSAELMELRAEKLHLKNYSFSNFETQKMNFSATVDLTNIPAVAKSFLGNSLSLTVSAAQSSISPNIISYQFEFGKVPATVTLQTTITPLASDLTQITHDGELNISIPFIGKKLETQAAQYLPKILEKDANLIKQLLP